VLTIPALDRVQFDMIIIVFSFSVPLARHTVTSIDFVCLFQSDVYRLVVVEGEPSFRCADRGIIHSGAMTYQATIRAKRQQKSNSAEVRLKLGYVTSLRFSSSDFNER